VGPTEELVIAGVGFVLCAAIVGAIWNMLRKGSA
jgi:hypothetical protein